MDPLGTSVLPGLSSITGIAVRRLTPSRTLDEPHRLTVRRRQQQATAQDEPKTWRTPYGTKNEQRLQVHSTFGVPEQPRDDRCRDRGDGESDPHGLPAIQTSQIVRLATAQHTTTVSSRRRCRSARAERRFAGLGWRGATRSSSVAVALVWGALAGPLLGATASSFLAHVEQARADGRPEGL